jgi:hypothetical protein
MIHSNGYFYTGVQATEEQERAMRRSFGVPYIVVSQFATPCPEETVHACALACGLPEIRGFYGYDFTEHQFLRMPGADQGEPDHWPSHRLSDILRFAGLEKSRDIAEPRDSQTELTRTRGGS